MRVRARGMRVRARGMRVRARGMRVRARGMRVRARGMRVRGYKHPSANMIVVGRSLFLCLLQNESNYAFLNG